MRELRAKLLAAFTLVLVLGLSLLFGWQQRQSGQLATAGLDPAGWAAGYPQHYASFARTADDYGRTAHGGSEPYDKLAANPFRRRAFAGNAFALEYKAARGHHYALQDQLDSGRTQDGTAPAGCINCHAAEAPLLIGTLGWDALHALAYDDVKDGLRFGSTCNDCHDPATLQLQITRPALATALQAQGRDPAALGPGELRQQVCAQCHVEYYFTAQGQQLVLPWRQGWRLEDLESYYDGIGHSDWTHAETGAQLLKVQHPETELHGSGLHAQIGLGCVDCHMPKVEEGGMQISDHWIRSPLQQLEAACLGCHRRETADSLQARVVAIQDDTSVLLAAVEAALSELMDAIVAARAAGADAAALANARRSHRRAQLRWDFIDAENSTGFHAAQEARRVLEDAVALARAGVDSLQQ